MKQTADMSRIKKIHLVGVGGSGMCGIAEILLNKGYCITGSDLKENVATKRLQKLGAQIYFEHNATNLNDADAVVISAAIGKENPEVIAAHQQHLPVLQRAQMLGELMRLQQGIAVAGTHGKTTTTSLIASILTEAKMDPTFVIGGLLNSAGTNAKLGKGSYFVAEADESDASFLYLNANIAVVTNIDADHMQTYHNNFSELKQTFVQFLQRLPFFGLAVVCYDDQVVREILPDIARPIITYGFSEEADVVAYDFEQKGTQCQFMVRCSTRADLPVVVNLAGTHNVLNALAAIIVARECGVDDEAICCGLKNFQGVARRLQPHGEINFKNGKALLLEDYGHHPREIMVTLEAMRNAWPGNRIVLAFQPHRYTRTQDLFDEFARVLSDVDLLVLLEVYAAGEEPIPGVSGITLARSIRQRGRLDPIFVPTIEELPGTLNDVILDGDIVLLQGAGNIGTVPAKLLAQFNAP